MKNAFLKNLIFYFENIKPTLSEDNEKYNTSYFKKDFLAALTVSVVLIPNVIGYAILAGLPPVMGLYAALPAVAIASLWGSSRYIVTAPVGVVSLLAMSSLSEYAKPNTSEFITLAISLAVLVGLIQFALGFFRLGIFARLIPHSVIVGFTNAAALLIIFSQLPLILGHSFQDTNFHNLNIFSIILGLVTILIVFFGKRFFSKFPISLSVILTCIVFQIYYGFEQFNIALIGNIPSGLPEFSLGAFSIPIFLVLIKQAFLIAIVGFVETYSISKTLAAKKDEKINPDKELNGQGLANIFSGFFGGFPVSGSYSASALNYNNGAKSAVAGIIISFIILLALILLGPLLSDIPKPVLAAIVIVAISQLINFRQILHIFKLSKTDGFLASATLILAILLKPDEALFIGIFLAIFMFVYRGMNLKVTELGIHKIHNSLWSRESIENSELELFPDKIIVRLDYSLIFSNADLLEELIGEKITLHEKEFETKIKVLVLNCGGVNYIDLSGMEAMQNLKKIMKKKNIELMFMLVKDVVYQDFKNANILENVKYIHGFEELKKELNFQ